MHVANNVWSKLSQTAKVKEDWAVTTVTSNNNEPHTTQGRNKNSQKNCGNKTKCNQKNMPVQKKKKFILELPKKKRYLKIVHPNNKKEATKAIKQSQQTDTYSLRK